METENTTEKSTDDQTPETPFHSGFSALIGRPNSGKSTLLNAIIGQHLAITSPLPQTTQRNMKGIYNSDSMQIVFVDTPGIHLGKHQLNKEMYNLSVSVLNDSGLDILCYMVDMDREFGEEEDMIAAKVAQLKTPVCVVLNKVDNLSLPEAEQKQAEFNERYPDLAPLPQIMLSSLAEDAGEIFIKFISPYIPEGPKYYPEENLTDENMRYFAAEYIRQQIIKWTHEEVPHAAHVSITDYIETDALHQVEADIHVETSGQKAIIIGAKGQTISKIRRGAEKRLRGLSRTKTKVNIFVKITPHWRDKKAFLKEAGFGD